MEKKKAGEEGLPVTISRKDPSPAFDPIERMLESGLTDPYFTMTGGWTECANCGVKIAAQDFIQRPRWRPRNNLTTWHYDCDDPGFSEGMRIAREDAANQPTGHKREVNSYDFTHRRNRRK